jgi:hypothetical protein
MDPVIKTIVGLAALVIFLIIIASLPDKKLKNKS